MASVKGFELKAIKGFRGENGEPMQQANLYYENKKVGLLSDAPNGGTPIIDIDKDFQDKWKEAVSYFKEELYDGKDVATEEELFYFLLTLKEWERIYKQQEKVGANILTIFEEIDSVHGYRTGGYQVYASESSEELSTLQLENPSSHSEESVEWRKVVFGKLEEMDFN